MMKRIEDGAVSLAKEGVEALEEFERAVKFWGNTELVIPPAFGRFAASLEKIGMALAIVVIGLPIIGFFAAIGLVHRLVYRLAASLRARLSK